MGGAGESGRRDNGKGEARAVKVLTRREGRGGKGEMPTYNYPAGRRGCGEGRKVRGRPKNT